MAARSTVAEGAQLFGQFHQNCGREVELSEDRRVASGPSPYTTLPIAFSNTPIPNGLKFSVKTLEKIALVSPCIPHFSVGLARVNGEPYCVNHVN